MAKKTRQLKSEMHARSLRADMAERSLTPLRLPSYLHPVLPYTPITVGFGS